LARLRAILDDAVASNPLPLQRRGVPVSDMVEMLDVFLDWLTGAMDERAGELAKSMNARAGRR